MFGTPERRLVYVKISEDAIADDKNLQLYLHNPYSDPSSKIKKLVHYLIESYGLPSDIELVESQKPYENRDYTVLKIRSKEFEFVPAGEMLPVFTLDEFKKKSQPKIPKRKGLITI